MNGQVMQAFSLLKINEVHQKARIPRFFVSLFSYKANKANFPIEQHFSKMNKISRGIQTKSDVDVTAPLLRCRGNSSTIEAISKRMRIKK
ncbi:hypothetical protein EBO34_20245 [Alteribacter keqinensis]|uniref:Uncharacterized protein n=1 Tax=Alteribacter keqinensis TaxID=2483800 RepID=A0A3M7TN49_9BACI|nr:hypothetical protein EBO34_20245 [Alteribacter keqinensis]